MKFGQLFSGGEIPFDNGTFLSGGEEILAAFRGYGRGHGEAMPTCSQNCCGSMSKIELWKQSLRSKDIQRKKGDLQSQQ